MTIQRIFHISDIHIMEKNYNNINHSFGILINAIKTYGIDSSLLVIAGDIFESKSFLNTDDIYQWKVMCLILKKERIKTLIMCGNHDYNINSELVRDNVTLLTLDCDNIICVNKTGIVSGNCFGDARLEFYIFSPIDKLIPTLANNDCIKIALLHEPVNYAIYDNGENISNGRFAAADLTHFDYVLLGDIHLTQFLTPRIAYCGSFVQKNKGEGIHKGYILWNLQSGIGTFAHIPLKELYIKIEAYNDTCDLPVIQTNQSVRHTSLIYSDCSVAYIDNLKQIINNKYNYINRIVNNTKLEKNKDATNTIDTGTGYALGHEIIIKTILKDNALLPAILVHHNNILRNRSEHNFTTYHLNYLCFSNVFCYGENNYINFNEFSNNLVMLNGKNKEGKSSIIDIIIRVLFNECERGFKEDIVNKSKNKGFIKISFNIGIDEYVIEQVFNRSAKSQQHRLYKNNDNITCDTMINTYQFLREKIGLGDYKDFVNMTTAMQNRKFLVDMPQKDFVSLLTKITNIDILKDVEDETKKKINVLKGINKKINADLLLLPDVTLTEIQTLQTQMQMQEKIRNDALEHINTINCKLVAINRDYNNITIPNDLQQQLNNASTTLQKYKNYTTTLTLQQAQQKYWTLKKTLASIPEHILHNIKKNDYSALLKLNRQQLIKQIKHLTEITYKPNTNNIRETHVLQNIIQNYTAQHVQPLERCTIAQLIVVHAEHENEALVQNGLPNYEQIKLDFVALKIKIEQFTNGFGMLQFNNTCAACNTNTSIIKTIFDIESESAKLINLKNIYDMRKQNKLCLTNAIAYKNSVLQNSIFTNNCLITNANNIIVQSEKIYNTAVCELRESVNKQNWLNLQNYEQQLNLFKEYDIQIAECEYSEIVIAQTYLLTAEKFITLQSLEKIKLTNAGNTTSINKLNALSVINNTTLTDACKIIAILTQEYHNKQNSYATKCTLLKSHEDNINELDFNELYLRVINCKTGIPSHVLKNTCLRLQNNCNVILQKISDFTIVIEYEKDIKVYTVENDIKIPAQMGSGMQKFILDLIIRITLTEISSVSSPKILFIDEGFGSLDRDNFIAVATVLQKLKSNFDSLIIISHITELRNYVDLSINITRKNYLSNVQYGNLSNAQQNIQLLNNNACEIQRVNEFKEIVKNKKSAEKQKNNSANNVNIIQYYNTHGGQENVLLHTSGNVIHCYGCDKDYTLKKNFAERHVLSETHKIKHNKYITSLL